MSGKCNCPASKIFPHRKNKCTFRKAAPAVLSIATGAATAASAVIPREPSPSPPPPPAQQQRQVLPVAVATVTSTADDSASLPTGVFAQAAVDQEGGEVDNLWHGLGRCADSPPSVAEDAGEGEGVGSGEDDLAWTLTEGLAGKVRVGGEESCGSSDSSSSSAGDGQGNAGAGVANEGRGVMRRVTCNTVTALAAAASTSATASAPDTNPNIPAPALAPALAPEQAALPVPESIPVPAATQRSPSTASDGAVTAPAAPTPKFTVLIIHHNSVFRKLLNRNLNSICGNMLQVVEAKNGQNGVDKLGALIGANSTACECDVRVVFIDNNMPVMNGHEAVKFMRSEVGYKGLIVGLPWDTTAQEDIDSFLDAGADQCFTRPILGQVRVLMEALAVPRTSVSPA